MLGLLTQVIIGWVGWPPDVLDQIYGQSNSMPGKHPTSDNIADSLGFSKKQTSLTAGINMISCMV